jgi:hypothetical protein
LTLFSCSIISASPNFLIAKINFCYERKTIEELSDHAEHTTLLFDINDSHTKILLGIYNSMCFFSRKSYKEAINSLNEIINTQSFKDYFHGNMNVKLTLSYFYITIKEYDLAENILKSISRKIKTEKLTKYDHVILLIKALDLEINHEKNAKSKAKMKDLITLFIANNTKNVELLPHLIPELKTKYLSQ